MRLFLQSIYWLEAGRVTIRRCAGWFNFFWVGVQEGISLLDFFNFMCIMCSTTLQQLGNWCWSTLNIQVVLSPPLRPTSCLSSVTAFIYTNSLTLYFNLFLLYFFLFTFSCSLTLFQIPSSRSLPTSSFVLTFPCSYRYINLVH